jgi:cyclopropane fatty-acyl-phospholipid synthase-like methyltransferase
MTRKPDEAGGLAAANTLSLYHSVANRFDRDRCKTLMEGFYLREIAAKIKDKADILDLGCGGGEPIAHFFLEGGCHVTGVDAARAMIEMCHTRFPEGRWVQADMRLLKLRRQFDAIIAWDSFFHLTAEDQRNMFPVFQDHIAGQGLLLFTSGHRAGTAMGDMYGHPLFHASLDSEEYISLLTRYGFQVLLHRVEDPACGDHTVWLAQNALV